jgi:hypothetical protein
VDAWAWRSASAIASPPVTPEALLLPPDDGVWGHDQWRAAPVGPPCGEGHPEQPVGRSELRALVGRFSQANRLRERELLQGEGAMGLGQGGE